MTQMIPPIVATHQVTQAIATRRPERARLFNSSSVIFSFPPTISFYRKTGGGRYLRGSRQKKKRVLVNLQAQASVAR
jgi:hypothetical protein